MNVNELPIESRLKELLIREKGITELYPPQEEAVKKGLFTSRKNFLLVTQTASGKTLLAEVLLANEALKKDGIGVYLSPLKALASEKYRDFQVYERLGINVALTYGDFDKADTRLGGYDVIIATYEKLDSLLRHKPNWLSKIKTVVIDEIHFIDDDERGPVLESLIAKLKLLLHDVRIISMSATIGNPSDLARWLNAELVSSGWRPVPLIQGVFHAHKITYDDGSQVNIERYFDHPVLDLVRDTVMKGGQALVFVHSRKRAVDLANVTSRKLSIAESKESAYYAMQLLESSEVPSLNQQLSNLVKRGISYHHAGLTHEQRSIIEEAFRAGAIKVIYATPTLAAGVNLPARRVVIEDYKRYSGIYGFEQIKVLEYKQFAGRAGRPGYDDYGESILIARTQRDVNYLISRYIDGEPESIQSKLLSERALRCHLLALIATLGPLKSEKIREFFRLTFYGSSSSMLGVKKSYEKTISFLSNNGFIKIDGNEFISTKLGKMVSEVYLDPMSVVIFRRLVGKIPKQDAVMGYLYTIAVSPDMPPLLVRRREEEFLEREEESLYGLLPGTLEDANINSWETYLSRIKTTLFLYDWINEVPEQVILDKYDLGPGDIRSLTETAEWIAHGLGRVSTQIDGLSPKIREIYESLEIRIKYGVKEELIELISLPGIGRVRARRLYMAGFKTLEDIASATPAQLKKIEGIGEGLSTKIIEEARKLIGAPV